MMRRKRSWIILGVAAALIVGGAYLATRQTNGQTPASQLLADLQTTRVIRTTLSISVESSGSIIPNATVQLKFGTSSTVSQVDVAPGDRVEKGDALAMLDTTDLQLALAKAEQAHLVQQLTYSATIEADPGDIAVAQASYNSALAAYNIARQEYASLDDQETVQCSQLTNARDALERAQTAYDRLANDHQARNYLNSDWGPYQSVVNTLTNAQAAYEQALANCNITRLSLNDSALRLAQTQLQSAKTKLDDLLSPSAETLIQAKARLEQAQLSLEEAQQNLAEATLVAPFDGVITAVNATVGGSSGSSAAIEIVDVSRLHVDVLVDETEIAQVQVGQKVQITLDALSDITLTGQVARIDPAGTVSSGVVNYSVRVDLDPSEAPLRLDMTANASIQGEMRENVLAVPTTAIQEPGQGLAALRAQGGFSGRGGLGNFGGQEGQGGFPGQGGQDEPGDQGGFPGQGGLGRQALQGSFVLVLADGQIRLVPVTVGITAGDLTEVSGDLQEGDQVVITTLSSSTANTNFPGGGFFIGGPPGGGGPPPDVGAPIP
jgi:HlyD family secretion protein